MDSLAAEQSRSLIFYQKGSGVDRDRTQAHRPQSSSEAYPSVFSVIKDEALPAVAVFATV